MSHSLVNFYMIPRKLGCQANPTTSAVVQDSHVRLDNVHPIGKA